jgi:hypothetical protein
MTAIAVDVECKHCGRFLFRAVGTVVIEGMICTNSKCKAKLNIKIVTPQSEVKSIKHKFTTPEGVPKAKE